MSQCKKSKNISQICKIISLFKIRISLIYLWESRVLVFICYRSKKNLWEPVLSFHQQGPSCQIQILGLVSIALIPLLILPVPIIRKLFGELKSSIAYVPWIYGVCMSIFGTTHGFIVNMMLWQCCELKLISMQRKAC